MLRLMLALVLLGVSATRADASPCRSGQEAAYLPDEVESLVEALKYAMPPVLARSPRLTSRQRQIVGDIDLVICDGDRFDIRAKIHNDRRVIVMDDSFIQLFLDFSEAIVFASGNWGFGEEDLPYEILQERYDYLQGKTARLRSVKEHLTDRGYRSYEVSSRRSSYAFVQAWGAVLGNVFSFYHAHEVCHHLEGHLPRSSSSIQDEVEADQCAFKLARDYQMDAGIAVSQGLVLALLVERDNLGKSGSHPKVRARLQAALDSGSLVLASSGLSRSQYQAAIQQSLRVEQKVK